ncbi:phosphoglucosamine mutase [Pseudoflavonifractor phocaeensis]|uniref:phosphoglucosamine mutase n=1 Tax=Pseudoflavonifractor phocaeensis TaxID=1870988 RepID=UPI00210DE43C|nr:phosphoglucosamine mutase [Pseudoflavonifractor phocaeensis]MCQ4866494.1 phosphoglucosamine mutase [Pseudoflavonifractor phocaeensis]
MGKLFGTDGIRGVVNAGLDAALAYQVGLAAAQVLAREKHGKPLVTIGKDTRISSDLLEGALIAGLCSAGADVLHLGVIPTPGVAWITVDRGADAGIVISASHNPFEHNGIKIFDGRGFKLSDALEEEIEEIILGHVEVPLKTHGDLGQVIYADERERDDYIDHLASTVDADLSGLRILVDCANGASSATAARLFDRFPKLHTDIINADPDGVNINAGCGSTHLDSLCTMVKAGGYDLGLAFDGDADRCLACDELGADIDGDQIMAVCGRDLKNRGELPGDAVVATVMSNLGLHVFCRENGLQLLCTDVGDRNVLEKMEEQGYVLGGEQSGHMIFRRFATTGDGQLTALQLLNLLHKSGEKASQLTGHCRRYPQVLVNVPVADKEKKTAIMASERLKAAVAEREAALNGDGRILVRPSGTEALIRVMVEAREEHTAANCANELAELIKLL